MFSLDRIKSAYEMAMERFKQRKEVPQSEIERMELIPQGQALAAKFLREKEFDILSEVEKQAGDLRKYIIEGVQETFLNNLQMPGDKDTMEANKKAMEGLLLIKKNKNALKETFGQLEHLFQYYERTMEQAFGQFKERYAAKMSASLKKLEQRTGQKIKADPEKQPGFREEWMRAVSGINNQYEQLLREQKEKIRALP
ncbi:hypothetical protein Pmgp_00820 [Pelotomaculum propionicicum]|uniref:Uncharacterized protein n=2 Tax=Pelotomaculum propionicicum TaxID=258475 RepID=A0A4Y7RUT0_9FIRM|nr:hypothetical protein [Peptococcaceae bacterium]TEB12489.1 hypothetical protein Pmgp_00820 [Pelotomaculum propionicicum]